VSVTYDGAPAAPIYPGSYAVVATIDDPNYEGSTAATLRVQATAVVKDELAVAGELDGSVQLLSGVDRAIEANATITGDVLLPGAPRVKIEGHPTYAGVTDAAGATTPSDYTFALKGSALARYVVRRVDPVALPVVTAPATPVGTRNVTLNRASDPIGDFATLRNLTLNGNAGTFVLPPGVYDTLTVNGGSTLVLGDATATDPVVYELQQLKLNGTATVQLVGPVIVKLANGLTLNGTFGSSEHPEWLELRVWRDGVALNSKATLHGTVVSPNARVVINGGAALHGRVTASDLTINGNGMLSEPAP
jgi:rhamnogalacturonan endolyase